MFQTLRREKLFVASGALFAVASIRAGTLSCALLAWLSLFLLIIAARRSRSLHGWMCWGLAFHAIAFYWIPYTISYFGNFPAVLSALLFVLFCFVSSLQLVCCGWIRERLRNSIFESLLLSLPLAWIVTEFLFPRLFPWGLGHTQIVWQELAIYARYCGVYPLGFFMLWGVESIVASGALFRKQPRKALAILCSVVLLGCLTLWCGRTQSEKTAEELSRAAKVKIGVIQGNLEAKRKRDSLYLAANLAQYRQLSQRAVNDGAQMLIWPESVVTKWLDEHETKIEPLSEYNPYLGLPVPLLYGGLSYRLPDEEEVLKARKHLGHGASLEDVLRAATKYYNTAFGLNPLGEILGHYNKKVLMPFGEFIPFADLVPLLKELSPQSGDFTPGVIDAPIKFNLREGPTLSISVLICYEDLIAELSRQSARLGGNLLVNLTNDAWYGDTAAPRQHNLLAEWRAIETERYFIRSTNTGLTAVIDPLGRTILELPVFESAYGIAEITPLNSITPYVRWGDGGTEILVLLCLGAVLIGATRKVRRGGTSEIIGPKF